MFKSMLAAAVVSSFVGSYIYAIPAALADPFAVCKSKSGKLRLIDAGAGDVCGQNEEPLGVIGAEGPPGPPGADGADGADSTVPGPPGPPGTSIQVLDGNLNEVGTFLVFDSGGRGAGVTRTFTDIAGKIRNVLLLIRLDDEGQLGIFGAEDASAIYLDADCTLDPFVNLGGGSSVLGGAKPFFDRTWVVEDQAGKKRVLVANGPGEIVNQQYYELVRGRCLERGTSFGGAPAEELDGDIEGTAPPPYTIEISNGVE